MEGYFFWHVYVHSLLLLVEVNTLNRKEGRSLHLHLHIHLNLLPKIQNLVLLNIIKLNLSYQVPLWLVSSFFNFAILIFQLSALRVYLIYQS